MAWVVLIDLGSIHIQEGLGMDKGLRYSYTRNEGVWGWGHGKLANDEAPPRRLSLTLKISATKCKGSGTKHRRREIGSGQIIYRYIPTQIIATGERRI